MHCHEHHTPCCALRFSMFAQRVPPQRQAGLEHLSTLTARPPGTLLSTASSGLSAGRGPSDWRGVRSVLARTMHSQFTVFYSEHHSSKDWQRESESGALERSHFSYGHNAHYVAEAVACLQKAGHGRDMPYSACCCCCTNTPPELHHGPPHTHKYNPLAQLIEYSAHKSKKCQVLPACEH